MKTVEITNRKAYHDYFINDTLECGIVLKGNEVKSIRAGKCSIKESYCTVNHGKLLLTGMHIAKYDTANTFDVDEIRDKILLAHKKEIQKLAENIKLDGATLIPLKIYFTDRQKCKVLVGICTGKKKYDKRQCEKEKQIKRDIMKYSQ